MYNSDHNWAPPYYPPNPNPTDPHHYHHHHHHAPPPPPPPPPPSFASAPPYAPPTQTPQTPSSYPPFPPIPDQSPLSYPPNPNPNPNPNLGLGSYGYNSSSKIEYGVGYSDEGYGGGYGGYDGSDQRLNSGSGSEFYSKRGDSEKYEMGWLNSYGKGGESERYEMGYGGGYDGGNNNNNNNYQRLNSGSESYGRSESERYGVGNGTSQRLNVGSESNGNKRGENERYEMGLGMYKDDGVYAYEGKKEPYGARGTGPKGSNWSGLFDDYGRPISFPDTSEKKTATSLKVVKAVPKVETDIDVKSGVQKFRVKLLPESGGSTLMDVLCMVGLDGIRMLDPSTSRTLRIYPLDTVTRCDKIDSTTFAFWSKTSVDVEPRRIRLQSNSYTTNTILDTVTAAMVQLKEMGGGIRPVEAFKAPEQSAEKKKGFTDWITKLKPINEEKDHWVPDEVVSKCTGCGSDFSAFNRRHHCRNCGEIFCDKCTQGRTPLNNDDNAPSVRVCDRCMGEVTRRLSKAKEVVSRPIALHTHEDLAKKLQEEMEKNLRISGSKSEGSGRQMREVACPTCTVLLQVQVPSSGSETIECGVCQHPFLVSAH